MENNKGQKFEILETFAKNGYTYCKIRFIETNHTREVRKSVVNSGMVKDRYAKDIYGLACIGIVHKDYRKNPLYSKWKNMVDRCYNPKNKRYDKYGGNGVTVCDRWLCFEHFLEDVELVEGYKDYLKDNSLHLDKDVKQVGFKNKVYSAETCKFVTIEENMSHRDMPSIVMNSVKHSCYAISKEGERIYVNHIPSFAKKHNLQPFNIYRCLNGVRKSHKGWKFENEQ